MALIKCKECAKEISDHALACPSCGAPVKKTAMSSGSQWKRSITPNDVLLTLLVLAIIAWALSPSKTKEKELAAAECKRDLQCWGNEGIATADAYCKNSIEKLAKYDVRWTDGALGLKFSRFRWLNKDASLITFVGDKAQFQNGFGAYTPVTYECDLNQETKEVLAVRAHEGRLP